LEKQTGSLLVHLWAFLGHQTTRSTIRYTVSVLISERAPGSVLVEEQVEFEIRI